MGFFSRIKNKARAQVAPVMPMAPQPMPRPSVMPRRGGSFLSKIRDQAFDKIESGKIPARSGFLRGQYFGPPQENMGSDFRMPQKRGGLSGLFRKLQEQIKNQQRPQQMPQQNLDFLSRLPPNMMPEVDFSNIPQLPENFKFNPQMGQGGRELNFADYKPQDRQMMQYGGEARPGFVAGGPLSRAALSNIYRKNATARGIPVPGGLTSAARGASPLSDSLRRGTENLIIGGTGAGLAIGLDGTQELREPFSKDNLMFISPEAFGRDLAQLRMDVGSVVNLAKNKASEMGENINEYVSRARSAYDQQMNQDMEDQRMQELDAQQGMQPFSILTGPNMPLTRPGPTSPFGKKIEGMLRSGKEFFTGIPVGESGRTVSDMDREALDDILSDLEKKN